MDTSALDWSLVRSFLAVIDEGSLLGAARKLGSYQPTLSRQIAQLEKQLGTALFERTGRGLIPTEAGNAIIEAARRMELAASDVEKSLKGVGKSLRGSIRISASEVVAHFLMPNCITNLRLAYPEIHVDLVASNVTSNLLRREADIALRMVDPTQGSLIARRIGDCPLGAFASSSYLSRRGRPIRAVDLMRHDLVGMDSDDSLLRGLRAFGMRLERSHFAVRTDDQVAYARLVEEGAGIGFLTHFTAARLKKVQQVLPRLVAPKMPLWLVTHREIRSSALIQATYEHLAAHLPTLIA